MKTTARFALALASLTAAFLVSVKYSDRGVQFDLRPSDGASTEAPERAYDLSASRIFNRVLLYLKDSYVEPERIEPGRMLLSALDEIQNAVAEVVVTYDRTLPEGQMPARVKVSVNESSRTFEVGPVQSLWEMSFKLKEIFRYIQDSLGDDPDVKYPEIEYAAVNGILETLDPHSTLLPPRNYDEMRDQTQGKFGGLGIVISLKEGALTVVSPIPGTPASRAGIKSLDQIVRIGDESTVNMDLSEAVGLLRGEPGSKVTLWVLRQGWEEPKQFDVERAIIKIDSVTAEPLSDKIGYLRIKNFQENTYKDVKKGLEGLKKKMGGMQGLVLDLRDNPGGLLDQSIKISDLFVSDGALVSTVGQGNKLRKKEMAMRSGTEPTYPIVVLVNSGSASASEIVSGAIQNNGRGIVLGDTTFGKGSVQVIYEMQDKSALKLTVAQYLTPGEVSIQGRGIEPDLRTIPVTIEEGQADLFLPKNIVREGNLATALKNDATRDDRAEAFVRYLREPTKEDEEAPDPNAFIMDFEIGLAQKLLASAPAAGSRADLLKTSRLALSKAERAQASRIAAELSKLGVDWSEGPTPANPNVELAFTTSMPEGGALTAGESLKVKATVTNRGSEPIYRLKAITESDNGVFSDREFLFGKVEPGQSRSWEVEFKLPQDLPTRQDMVLFEVSDAKSIVLGGARRPRLALEVRGKPRPHFAFSYDIIDPNGDGILNPGEDVKMRVNVHNDGAADSAETLVYLKNTNRRAVDLQSGREKLEKVPKGGRAEATFTFEVRDVPVDAKEVEFELDVYDTTFREFAQRKLSIPYAPAPAPIAPATGAVTPAKGAVALRAGASKKSEVVATLAPGKTAPLRAKAGEWVKVSIDKERAAWALASEFKETQQRASATSADPLLYRSPSIALKPEATLTDKNSIRLSGSLADDEKIKDYYIFVYNRGDAELNTRKVGYHRVGATSRQIAESIPLFEGMNRVAVFVRDNDGMTATESAYVYRTPKDAPIARRP